MTLPQGRGTRMKIVLWDTRRRDVSKDFAGGMGVGKYHGRGGLRGRVIRWMFTRDRRPVALTYAYLAAIFRQLGHEVLYCENHAPRGADLYVFNPSLITFDLELDAIRQVRLSSPHAAVLVVGPLSQALPNAFLDAGATVVRGEPERLLWELDNVLEAPKADMVDVGTVSDLDALPFPDWSLFGHRRFRIGYDFSRFPTALIQQSRGCSYHCNYCPYILIENRTRFRSPESVLDEMRRDVVDFGFQSFKFRDPLFGLDRSRVRELAAGIRRLPQPVQFSVESRINLLPRETLVRLRAAGLTSVTVGIERPDAEVLRRHKRAPLRDDRQRQFILTCRQLGVRTVAGFMIGFPDDTPDTIRSVLRYAKELNPTFANFNIVTPYPGTEFFEEIRDQIASFDFRRYNVYTPLLRYDHLTADELSDWHAKCFSRYYFRWEWFRAHAPVLWPSLVRLIRTFAPAVLAEPESRRTCGS
ncbi:MAG TPA: radical SAM protein, partial [Planctomycetaceae bacterium]|nr:radical SAM protein [Planctomycetaceae bacterium]